MENSKTLDFIRTTRLSLIACADEKLLADFAKFISSAAGADIFVVGGIDPSLPRGEVSNRLAYLIESAANRHVLVPLKCEKYSELRSIYFFLPEKTKDKVGISVLKESDFGAKLECAFGVLQGRYMIYRYDKSTGMFSEKE